MYSDTANHPPLNPQTVLLAFSLRTLDCFSLWQHGLIYCDRKVRDGLLDVSICRYLGVVAHTINTCEADYTLLDMISFYDVAQACMR